MQEEQVQNRQEKLDNSADELKNVDNRLNELKVHLKGELKY